MEGKIIPLFDCNPTLPFVTRRVIEFESKIKAKDKELEISPQACAIAPCYLFVKVCFPF